MGEVAKEKLKGSLVNTDVSNSGSKVDIKNNKLVIKQLFVNVDGETIKQFFKSFGKNKSNNGDNEL